MTAKPRPDMLIPLQHVRYSTDLAVWSSNITEISSTVYRADTLDRRIIALLQPHGRMPFAEVATRLGTSESTVRNRYGRLVHAGILQVVGVADPFKIGFTSMAMIGVKVAMDPQHGLDSVARDIALFPEVSYVVMSTGSFDILVEVIAASNEEFVLFLTEKLHRVQGVHSTETFMLLRVYKLNLGGWRMAPTENSVDEGHLAIGER